MQSRKTRILSKHLVQRKKEADLGVVAALSCNEKFAGVAVNFVIPDLWKWSSFSGREEGRSPGLFLNTLQAAEILLFVIAAVSVPGDWRMKRVIRYWIYRGGALVVVKRLMAQMAIDIRGGSKSKGSRLKQAVRH
jgi:hypothetical protein